MRKVMMPALLAAVLSAGVVLGAEPVHTPRAAPPPSETSCVSCHSQLDGTALEPVKHLNEDVHFTKGLSCHDCHGGNPWAGADGDPDAAHDVSKGWTGKPDRLAIPAFCAKCHAQAPFMKKFNPQARIDQLSEYRTSMHGQLNAAGDKRVAVCVDCHGVHGIRRVGDPQAPVYPTNLAKTCARCHSDATLMKAFNLPTKQHDDYMTSVHARALYEKGDISAPTCNDCHGSHGATPPGVAGVANVCGSCHGREATLFREIEAKRSLDLEPCIQCLMCHGNHAIKPPTDSMLGVGPQSTCTGCHAESDPGFKAAAQMSDFLIKLQGRLDEASGLLDEAERAGIEVSPDRFALRTAKDDLVESKVLVHSFDMERFAVTATKGIATADEGVAAGHRAFAELRTRRTGLVLSLVVIMTVIVSLGLYIRRIER